MELKDGRLLQIIRTQTGYMWESFSRDGGDTWTDAKPTTVEAPEAPSTITRIPGTGELLLVWNPNVAWGNPEKTVVGANHGGPRTPLAAAISRDEGRTWSPPKLIESDPNVTYAYTSITFHDGRALLTYYWFPLKTSDLSLKFKSIPLQWFRE